jgi:uncharacterized membrane protein YhaH (DUF805 family)
MQRIFYVLLNFNGRIKRRTWLVFFFVIAAAEYCCQLLFGDAFHISGPVGTGQGLFSPDYFGDRADLLAGLIFLWPSLALDVKRWHDIGRSGYYTLIFNGPIFAIYAAGLTGAVDVPEPQASRLMSVLALIFLVYFIMLAAKQGTAGANRFGPARPLPFQVF